MIALGHTEKPSRKVAFDLVCAAKTRALAPHEIDSLINFFAPKASSSPKTAFQWVALAVSVADIRQYLQFVRVSNGVMYATDGHRLHWANAADLLDGYYDAKTQLQVPDDFIRGRFPDVRRVIPKIEGMTKFEGEGAPSVRRINKKEVFTLKYSQMTFNKKYVDEARIEGPIYLDQEKMRGANEFGEFVIMNMRV